MVLSASQGIRAMKLAKTSRQGREVVIQGLVSIYVPETPIIRIALA